VPVWTVDGAFELIYRCVAADDCPGAVDYTFAYKGSQLAWLGGTYDDEGSLSQPVSLPTGAVSLRVRADTSFQTVSPDLQTDTLDLELYDSNNSTRLGLLASYSDEDASETSTEWTADFIDEEIDVSAWAGQAVRVRFSSKTDSEYYTDFFIDNVRVSVTVCN
jgi:hypothetical protein